MLGLRHVFEHINTTSQLNCHPFLNRNFYSCLCWAQKLDYLAPNSIVELASFYMFLSKLIIKITLFIYLFIYFCFVYRLSHQFINQKRKCTTVPPHTHIHRSQNFFRKQKNSHLSIFNGLIILTKPKQQNGDPMAG